MKRIPVNAVGRVTCDGEPLPNVQLRLMDSVPFRLDAKLAYTRTDENGNFNVTSKGSKVPKLPKGRLGVLLRLILAKRSRTPRPFIKVEYSYRSVNGSLKVLGVKRFRRFRRFFVRNDISEVVPFNSSGVDFGTINVSSIHCRAYLRFYEALQLFNTRAPTLTLPYRILFVKTETPNLGSDGPIATTKTILFPTMFQNITAEIANHEFAHTFRQSYDGDFRHFKNDLKSFNYTLRQACENKTNEGNAFNEGWAAYWSDGCNGSYGNNTQDYAIEGNVANALRALQDNCTSTFYQMVNVLKQNKMTIHSFQSFNEQHGVLYNCTLSS